MRPYGCVRICTSAGKLAALYRAGAGVLERTSHKIFALGCAGSATPRHITEGPNIGITADKIAGDAHGVPVGVKAPAVHEDAKIIVFGGDLPHQRRFVPDGIGQRGGNAPGQAGNGKLRLG